MVKLLLKASTIDVGLKDYRNWTPFLWAVGDWHKAVVKLLLKTGKVNINLKDQYR